MNLFDLTTISSSNLFHLGLTFFLGFVVFGLYLKATSLICALAIAVAICIGVSYVFNIGEVYEYHAFYKRAYFYFGDDVSTAMIVPLFLALASNARRLAFVFLMALILSGSKISFILIALALFTLAFLNSALAVALIRTTAVMLVIALPFKFGLDVLSGAIQRTEFGAMLAERFDADRGKGLDVCGVTSVCLTTQFAQPALDRLTSSVVGLKMTLDGGMRGEAYPSKPEKFAQYAISENPWGINERLGLSSEYWLRVGQVQTAYLHFGSGYGWEGLLLLWIAAGIAAARAFQNSRISANPTAIVNSALFITLITFNQFNPWIAAGSPILFLVGFCAAGVLMMKATVAQNNVQPPHVLSNSTYQGAEEAPLGEGSSDSAALAKSRNETFVRTKSS